jgi:hypothetical protein
MADTVTLEGQSYRKRHPIGVLALSVVTLGIYFFYWYYQVNDELRRFERDETISPVRSLMAMLFGWIIIVPPFIAMYNTAKHVRAIEERRSMPSLIEPALVIVLMLVLSIANGLYIQEHLNRIWDSASAVPPPGLPGDPGSAPSMPEPPAS